MEHRRRRGLRPRPRAAPGVLTTRRPSRDHDRRGCSLHRARGGAWRSRARARRSCGSSASPPG
jgi:hypothetical protein